MQPILKIASFALCVAFALIHTAAGADVWMKGQNGNKPCSAVIGGYDKGEPVYIARAHFEGGLLPGKLVSRLKQAYIPFAQKEYKVQNYEVLCSTKKEYNWRNFDPIKRRYVLIQPLDIFDPRPNNIPANAVVGGYSAVNKDTLYICRVRDIFQNIDLIGKFHPRHNACFYSKGGEELSYNSTFELLVKD